VTDLTLGILGGLGSALAWGVISILVRSLSGILRPVSVTVVRSTVAGAIMLALAMVTGHAAEVLDAPLWVVLMLWASILIAMGYGDTMFFASMDHLGVTRALTLSMANPLLTSVIGIGLLGEPVSILRASGILLVLVGLVLVISGKGEGEPGRSRGLNRGLRMVFMAAGAWALAAIIMKPPLQVLSVMAATAVRIPITGLVLWFTPWASGTVADIVRCSRTERVRLAAICLLSAVSSLLFVTGIKYGGVAIGNLVSSTAPLFTLPFEVWLFGRRPSRQTMLGAVTAITGIGFMEFG
jgi:drug/metabolite transporter (DMT)-like permease